MRYIRKEGRKEGRMREKARKGERGREGRMEERRKEGKKEENEKNLNFMHNTLPVLLAPNTLAMQQAMDKLLRAPTALASFLSTRPKLESSEEGATTEEMPPKIRLQASLQSFLN